MLRVKTTAAQLILFSIVALNVAHSMPLVTLKPTTSTVAPGDAVLADVSADGITNLYAFQFDVNFVPGVLAAQSVDQGTFLAVAGTAIFVPGRIDNGTGAIQMTIGTLVGRVPGVSGDGLLATIAFRALNAGTSPLTISNVILLDSQLQQIIPGTAGASVSVAPEPVGATLAAAGLAGLAALRRLQKHRRGFSKR